MDRHRNHTQFRAASRIIITLTVLFTVSISAQAQLKESEMQWLSFEEAVSIAEQTGKPVFVDIWAPWCGWCRKMKKEVYPDLSRELASNYVLTRINRDDNHTKLTYRGQQLTPLRLAQKLHAQTVPAMVLLSSRGDYLLHITGYMQEESLEPILHYISTEAYKSQSFETFRKERSSDR